MVEAQHLIMANTPAAKVIPHKLRNDALVEALLEIRFDTQTIPEILLGRLGDHPSWSGFEQRRLPAAEIPAPIRNTDRNLRYTPLLELADVRSARLVRLGEHVLSYHQLAPYVGWASFRTSLYGAIDGLFEKAGDVVVRRLGLRYVNALTKATHGVNGILDLDLTVSAAGSVIPSNVNLNFTTDVGEGTDCTVRIATNDFVSGKVPDGTSVVIDVDVFTKPNIRMRKGEDVKAWVDRAHTWEKEQFFRLLKESTIEALAEKS